MDFEEFEGFKRIKNIKHLKAEEIFSILEKYQNELGKLTLNENLEVPSIQIVAEEKFYVEVRVFEDEIVVERKAEESTKNDEDLSMIRTNRMIEQIYDLINDYMDDGVITEHITSVKETLYMREGKNTIINGLISTGTFFELINENNEVLYTATQNFINKIYSIKNKKIGREELVVKYNNSNYDEFTIIKPPFDTIILKKDENSVKTIFRGNLSTKEIKISADYTDNHYLIEVNEIVVGAVDCLDPLKQNTYNIEINNEEYRALIFAIAVILDIFNFRNQAEKLEKI